LGGEGESGDRFLSVLGRSDHCWEDQFFVNGDHFFLILERVIAGVFGAMTLPSQNLSQTKNLKTLYIETLPAIVAILLVSMIRN